MLITKEHIIKALQTETNLRPGQWISRYTSNSTDPECSVCAVGAVLRHPDLSSADLEDVARFNVGEGSDLFEVSSASGHLRTGNYLAALSCAYEGNDGDVEQTIDFVKANFPESFEVDV